MSAINPYESPSSASASTTSSEELKQTSVLLVIALQGITLGFYLPYWYTSRRKILNRLGGKEINLGLCIAAFVLHFLYILNPYSLQPRLLVLGVTLSLGIINLVLAFKVKDILEANFEDDFSGLLTFFLHIFYLQHKINSSERLDEAHQELPASVIGLR